MPILRWQAKAHKGGIDHSETYAIVEHEKWCFFCVDRPLTKYYVYEYAIEAWNRRAES